VDHRRVELGIFPDETEELRAILPYRSGKADGCAGLYTHDMIADSKATQGDEPAKQMLVTRQAGTRFKSRLST